MTPLYRALLGAVGALGCCLWGLVIWLEHTPVCLNGNCPTLGCLQPSLSQMRRQCWSYQEGMGWGRDPFVAMHAQRVAVQMPIGSEPSEEWHEWSLRWLPPERAEAIEVAGTSGHFYPVSRHLDARDVIMIRNEKHGVSRELQPGGCGGLRGLSICEVEVACEHLVLDLWDRDGKHALAPLSQSGQ